MKNSRRLESSTTKERNHACTTCKTRGIWPVRRPGVKWIWLSAIPWYGGVCILLVATLLACTGGGEDSARDERMLKLEAKAHSLEEGQIRTGERLDDLDARLQELEEAASKVESVLPDKEQWSQSKGERLSLPEGTALERTVRLAEDFGGRSTSSTIPDEETSQFW